jgi:hypothetical protein
MKYVLIRLFFAFTLLQPIPSNAQSGFKDLVDVADRLGILDLIKDKLISRPDPASDKLVVVLEEISKIYSSLDNELSSFLAIRFYDGMLPEEKKSALKQLYELQGGAVQARMSEARGHCSKIMNIYNRYLTGWFSRILDPTELREVEKFFNSLVYYDENMVDAIEQVGRWLGVQADLTLSHIHQGNWEQANRIIRKSAEDISADRKKIANVMSMMRKLQGQIIQSSGAVG